MIFMTVLLWLQTLPVRPQPSLVCMEESASPVTGSVTTTATALMAVMRKTATTMQPSLALQTTSHVTIGSVSQGIGSVTQIMIVVMGLMKRTAASIYFMSQP